MKRLVLPLTALLLALTAPSARAQLGRPPTTPFSRPVLSPFLNLNRPGTNPAINYFGLVRPQLDTQAELQQLQQAAMTTPYLDNTAVLNQPILNTGTGASFMTSNKYFMTAGRPGSGTGGLTTTQPQIGFRQR